jgi:hypothetical protein
VRSSSRVKGQFKVRSSSSSEKAVRVGVLEPSQPSHLAGPGRRDGPVGPREILGTTSAVKETASSDCNLLWLVIEVNKSSFKSKSTFDMSRYPSVHDNILNCV